jgi:hypothetical protein
MTRCAAEDRQLRDGLVGSEECCGVGRAAPSYPYVFVLVSHR